MAFYMAGAEAFGLLIHPRRSLELALQDMEFRKKINIIQNETESKYCWVSIGDGTDRGHRNIVVCGGRLIPEDDVALLKHTKATGSTTHVTNVLQDFEKSLCIAAYAQTASILKLWHKFINDDSQDQN